MISPVIADPPLKAYSKLLMILHRLIAEGGGDSDEADTIRDRMDSPWRELTPFEQDVARQLSADFYTLHENSNGTCSLDSDAYSPELAADLAVAQARGEYLRALRLMQSRSGDISAERMAILRGIFYRELGLSEVGLLFLEHASQASADSKSASPVWLGFLWQHVDLEAAAAAAIAGHFVDVREWK